MEEIVQVLQNVDLPNDICLSERDLCDLELLLSGALHPLNRYMDSKDVYSVMKHGRLADGTVWPMPIMCPIPLKLDTTTIQHDLKISDEATKNTHNNSLAYDKTIKIRNVFGSIIAEIRISDCYKISVEAYAKYILGTNDDNHPYYQYLLNLPPTVYVGGAVHPIQGIANFEYSHLRITPAQCKARIAEKGWDQVIGFQTRNPIHKSHFELTKFAVKKLKEETNGNVGLLVSPTCGPSQPGDVDFETKARCYLKVMPFYSEENISAALVFIPIAMRMAGPREAIWHAILRKNYGCTHFIIGRDHAGPSVRKKDGTSFYGTYDAQTALKSVSEEIGIKPVFAKDMLYIDAPYNMYVQSDDLILTEESKENYVSTPSKLNIKSISGSEFRRLLVTNEPIPEWFSFPPIIKELRKVYLPRHESGFCIYLTGLPCSGKSTLACAIKAALMEREEDRIITVLDADVVRTHLSSKLGFDKESRSINVRRIGYVASLITKNKGICIVANIAPYASDRAYNREIIKSSYIEVFVSTPLEICEKRDIKDLYKKARQGFVKQFTGVSDPYEIPEKPELTLDCSEDLAGKTNAVMDYLKKEQWIK